MKKEENKKTNPGKYKEWLTKEGLIKLEGWARDGLSDKQIAKNMGIVESTLYEYKKKYSEISEALKKGKEVVDRIVENALLKKTLGYNAEVNKTFKLKKSYYDENGKRCEEEYLESAIDEVHIPADTTAQIFWLRNRKRDQWDDKRIEDKPSAEYEDLTPLLGRIVDADD